MSINKLRIKKIEKIFKNLEPKYVFFALSDGVNPLDIIETKNGKTERIIKGSSKEGRELVKNCLVEYPEVPILIVKRWRKTIENSKPKIDYGKH